MISYISGALENKNEKNIVMDVNGFGYKVFISSQTFRKLPDLGSKIKVYCHLYLREEKIELYGFLNQEELNLFEVFLAISGIGPKAALNLTSLASPKDLMAAISRKDIHFLTNVSGLGVKRAEKIILELKDKLGKPESENPNLEDKEVFEALKHLGYQRREIQEAVKKMPSSIQGLENRTKEALKILGHD